MWCLGVAVMMSGCSGDGENTAAPSNPPIESIAPRDVTDAAGNLIPGVENKSYRFTDGSVFGVRHVDPEGKFVPVAVLLTFGDFGGTVSASFALVSADGFTARGVATWMHFYILHVQDSTFWPATQVPTPTDLAQKQITLGPQRGDRLALDFQSENAAISLTAQQVTVSPEANAGLQGATLTGPKVSSDVNSPVCGHRTSTNSMTAQNLGTLKPGGCLTVNGNIAVNDPTLGTADTDTYAVTVPPGRDVLVTFILTHPSSGTPDLPKNPDFFPDFDLTISASLSSGARIGDGTTAPFLRSCNGTRSPEI